jgi:branched-chain amino acid aminotransferase
MISEEMKILTWRLNLLGEVFKITPYTTEKEAASLDEVSLQLPGGAYTTFRTYDHTRALRIQDHMQRLSDSAERTHQQVSLAFTPLRAALRAILEQSPFRDARVRVTLDLETEPGLLYITIEELHALPPAAYLSGVKVTTHILQRENPKAKLTAFITTAAAYRAHLSPGVNETLMVQTDGRILEGLSSNFFGIKGGAMWTAEEGVLSGITRASVLDIASSRLGIPVHYDAIRADELEILDECFITSAGRGVLPVVQIDEMVIGKGMPGVVTKRIMVGFEEWIGEKVEEI